MVPLIAGKYFPSSSEAWDALAIPEKRKIMGAIIEKVVCAKGRGPDIQERIERPDAPDDNFDPPHRCSAGLDEVLATRIAERFVSLYRQFHPGAV